MSLLLTGDLRSPLLAPNTHTHTALRVFSGTHRYRKPAGLSPHSGLVAVVAGSSGKTQEGLGFNHPVHRRFAKGAGGLRGLLQCGSLVIDINATLLDVLHPKLAYPAGLLVSRQLVHDYK